MRGKDLQLFAGILIALALCVLAPYAFAQVQCVCTSGCNISSAPFPVTGAQPTLCNAYAAGVKIGSAPVVPSSSVPTSNSTVCSSATNYAAPPTGAVSCMVPIPAQTGTANTVVTLRAANNTFESGDSAALTFKSTFALPPTGLRVSP